MTDCVLIWFQTACSQICVTFCCIGVPEKTCVSALIDISTDQVLWKGQINGLFDVCSQQGDIRQIVEFVEGFPLYVYACCLIDRGPVSVTCGRPWRSTSGCCVAFLRHRSMAWSCLGFVLAGGFSSSSTLAATWKLNRISPLLHMYNLAAKEQKPNTIALLLCYIYNLVAKEQKPNTIAYMYYVYIHMYVSINRNLAVCVIVDLSSFIGQECVKVLFVVVVLLLRCGFLL